MVRLLKLSAVLVPFVVAALGTLAADSPPPPPVSMPGTATTGPLTTAEQTAILARHEADVKRLREAMIQGVMQGQPTESNHLAAQALAVLRPKEALPFLVWHIAYNRGYCFSLTLNPTAEMHPYLGRLLDYGEAGVQEILRQLRTRPDENTPGAGKEVTDVELHLYAYAILYADGFDEAGKKRAGARIDKVDQPIGAKPLFTRLRKAIDKIESPTERY